jgi:hypothetical protein
MRESVGSYFLFDLWTISSLVSISSETVPKQYPTLSCISDNIKLCVGTAECAGSIVALSWPLLHSHPSYIRSCCWTPPEVPRSAEKQMALRDRIKQTQVMKEIFFKQPIRGETDKWLHPPSETKFLEQIRLLISCPENSFIMQQGRQQWPPSPRIRQNLCFVFNITVMEFSETLL